MSNRLAGQASGLAIARSDSAVPDVRAIQDEHGRIVVLMTQQRLRDAFEEQATNHEYFLQFSIEGYIFGVNTLVYAMTH